MIGHLIHIGYPKTGSTYLRRWFADHPQIAYTPGGIAGFRNVFEIASQSSVPDPAIHYRVTSSEVLAAPQALPRQAIHGGDRGPGQDPVAQTRVRDALAQIFPTARILLVTRGFRSALLSGYSEYVRAGGEVDFRPFLEMTRQAASAGKRVWDYDFLIGLYEEGFKDRLIVMPYELLRDRPEQFTGELESRLGLAAYPPDRQRANPSLSPEELGWYPRLARGLRRLPLGERVGRRLLAHQDHDQRHWGLRPLVRLLARAAPAVKVPADIVTDEMVEFLRGRAGLLAHNPLYDPYRNDYLL